MDLLNIFLLTFTLLSGCIRDSSTEHNKIKYQKENEAIAAQSFTCPCFPQNLRGKRISELIAPIDINHKRLVVYIYKTNNNDFTTYVPNKEKQRVFPDLTFDEGDNLRYLNTEKVIDLYNINSELTINGIAKEVKKKESIDGTLQSDVHLPSRNPNDLWATIPHDIFETNQYDDDMTVDQAAIMQFLKKYPSTSDLIFPGDLLVVPSPPSQISISKPGINYPSSSDFPLQGDISLYSSAPAQMSESDTSVNYPSLSDFLLHGDLNIFPLAPGQISDSEINTNQQIISDSALHKDLNIFPPTVEQIAVPEININRPSTSDSLLERKLNMSPTAAGLIEVPEIKINRPSISELSSNQGLPVVPLKSEHSNSPQTSEKYPDVFTIPSDYNTIKKIDQWFEGNKNFIGNIDLPFLQTINHGQFIIILLKALHENGINLSKAGDLIDWNGNTLDMSKLKLMPVILGDIIDLNNLLGQNKCFTPFDLSFLQGILVTLTYPPRILGVIPLGKILEETAQYTIQPCYSDSNKQASRCGGGSCQIKTMTDKNDDITLESSSDRRCGGGSCQIKTMTDKNEDIALESSSDKRCGGGQCQIKTVTDKNEDIDMEPSSDRRCGGGPCQIKTVTDKNEDIDMEPSSDRRCGGGPCQIKTVTDQNQDIAKEFNSDRRCGGGPCQIKTVTDQNEDIAKESSIDRLGLQANLNLQLKSSDVLDSTFSHGAIEGMKNTKPVKDYSEDNILGLRIIGGHPATSSGTPVTSKGRSADV